MKILAHHDLHASVLAGHLAALERAPHRWHWPESTRAYLQYRIETLCADLVRDAETAVA